MGMKRRKRLTRALLAVIAIGSGGSGCVGNIGGAPSDIDEPALEPGDFACTPGDPSATVLPRLSQQQYLASLRALAAESLGQPEADNVLTALTSTLSLVPSDVNADHGRLDQDVSQAHVDGQYFVAVQFAELLTSTPERRDAVLGTCASDSDASNDDACIAELIRSFGYRAHRRPLLQAEVDFYRTEVFEPATGVELAAARDVITVMLLSPNFLYQLEIDGEPVADRDDLFELSAHELASRVAFHFWNEPADAELYAAAEDGSLMTEDGYAAQIDRMLDDPRTQATLDRYYSEWLLLDDLAPLDTQLGQPNYDAFVGANVPTQELRERLIEDVLDLARHTTWHSEGSFAELFTSDRSFAKTDDVAALYGGVGLWQEGTEPDSLPEGTRAGILTRPGMLATGSIQTHAVLRGREVRKRILCDEIPPPPAGATDDLPELDPIMTERERMEAITEQPGSSCLSCHAALNPIGWTLESYDGLGRLRTEETLYQQDGAVLATLPIDTSAAPYLTGDDDTVVANGIELSEQIAQSNVARACFARHYFRFTFSRLEDDDVDGCELENIRSGLEEGRSLKQIIRDIAMSQTFRRRKLSN
jgi:hypothetical protein